MNELKCWFAGVAWASESHPVRITDSCGKRRGERDFAHGGEGVAEMAAWLTSITGAEPSAIHVAIEIPHGPIVETLLDRELVPKAPESTCDNRRFLRTPII